MTITGDKLDKVHELGSLVKGIPQSPYEEPSVDPRGYGTVVAIGETPFHGVVGFDDIGIPSQHEATTVPVYEVSWSDGVLRWHLPWEIETISNGL